MRVRAYADSDVGRVRKGNEDSLYAGTSVFAVADGMGGHVAGEVASETALEPIRELDGIMFRSDKTARQALVDAIATANRTVVEKADADPTFRGMGTTLTAALIRDGKMHVAHVGDSRAYLLRADGELTQLTTDHTLVERLISEGRLSRDEAATHPQRSVITRAIGIESEVDVDALPALALQPGDQVLLCSDGLTGPVDDTRVTGILSSTPDGDAACQALIDAANDAGGPDNITVVLLRVEESGDPSTAPTAPTATAGDAGEAGDAGDAGDAGAPTEELAPIPRPDGDDGGITQIRTRQESGRDWATSMREYGAPQGADKRSVRGSGGGSGRVPRVLAGLLGLVIIAGLIVGGGYLLLARAWYVGADDDNVAVFRGLPSEVAGLRLARMQEQTDVALDDLPPRRAERIRQGITFGSEAEAEDFVERLREELAEAEAEAEAERDAAEDPADTADPGAGPGAGPDPAPDPDPAPAP